MNVSLEKPAGSTNWLLENGSGIWIKLVVVLLLSREFRPSDRNRRVLILQGDRVVGLAALGGFSEECIVPQEVRERSQRELGLRLGLG